MLILGILLGEGAIELPTNPARGDESDPGTFLSPTASGDAMGNEPKQTNEEQSRRGQQRLSNRQKRPEQL